MPMKGERSGVYVNCEVCGKEVYMTKTRFNKANHHFCGTKCMGEYSHIHKTEDRNCEYCGGIFHAQKSSQQRFCCMQCQSEWQKTRVGENNPKFTREQIECPICHKMFYAKKYKINGDGMLFCSIQCKRKWYAETWSQTDECREASRQRALSMLENGQFPTTNTKPQKIVNKLLEDLEIEYINEYNCKYYSIDNYLPSSNLMIEVMGDFWHCSPQKYNTDEISDTQRKRIGKDKAKHSYIKNKYNIEILYLWESDIYDATELCSFLIERYINNKGVLENYNSFNYHIENGNIVINDFIIKPYQESNVNA